MLNERFSSSRVPGSTQTANANGGADTYSYAAAAAFGAGVLGGTHLAQCWLAGYWLLAVGWWLTKPTRAA